MKNQSSATRDPFTIASVGILFILVGLTITQVIMRSVFNFPLIGAEELARYFLICIVFIGTPIAAKERTHISMIELQVRFPPLVRVILDRLVGLCWVGVFALLSFSVITALINNIDNRTVNLGIPAYIFLAPTVIGFLATAIISAVHLYRDARGTVVS